MVRSYAMPFGAEVREDGSVRFRLWAPKASHVELTLENPDASRIPLTKLDAGWFELVTSKAGKGSRYRFSIDGATEVPDPASRFQPSDVHGPSEVVDPRAFDWEDENWVGRPWEETILYELHVGAFTAEGTFEAMEQRLDYLRDLGVTAIELMPLADFPGRRNWGYDGVLPFAPDSSYGRPESLKRLVQAAHARGLMVFLDVVYNHFGPEGNYLHVYAPQFFTSRHRTPWGDGINFDGPESRVVRDFFIHNALYWFEEYHIDGLRLDAVHAIIDDSKPDILTELAETVRKRIGPTRHIHLVLENVDNASRYLRRNGFNRVQLYTAQWNDDMHHALHVIVTGESDGYYSDYANNPIQKFCRCLTEGFAYQGEYSAFHGAKRGEASTDLPSSAFVSFLQNHDQVGNRAFGDRIGRLVPERKLKAAMEILLLAPTPPLLFMGEEFGADSPFLFFCDFKGELASAVTQGRRNEFEHFAKFRSPELRDQIPDPNQEATFLRSKLDWNQQRGEAHARWLEFYRELLSIRRRFIARLLANQVIAHVNVCDEEDRALSIDWDFANGPQLQLRANLGNIVLTEGMDYSGTVIYSGTPGNTEFTRPTGFAPLSVVWSIRP